MPGSGQEERKLLEEERRLREEEKRLREDELLYFTFCARSAPLICAVTKQHLFPLLPPVYFYAVTAHSLERLLGSCRQWLGTHSHIPIVPTENTQAYMVPKYMHKYMRAYIHIHIHTHIHTHILWMDGILHHVKTIKNHCLLVLAGK